MIIYKLLMQCHGYKTIVHRNVSNPQWRHNSYHRIIDHHVFINAHRIAKILLGMRDLLTLTDVLSVNISRTSAIISSVAEMTAF